MNVKLIKEEKGVSEEKTTNAIDFFALTKEVLFWIILLISGYFICILSYTFYTFSLTTSWYFVDLRPNISVLGHIFLLESLLYLGIYIYSPIFLVLLLWEPLWLNFFLKGYQKYKDASSSYFLFFLGVAFIATTLPFLLVRFISPFLSNYTTFAFNTSLDSFLEIYWLLPLWLISWTCFWILRIPQHLFRSKNPLTSPYLVWIAWLILIHIILWTGPLFPLPF